MSDVNFELITKQLIGKAKRKIGLQGAEDVAQDTLVYAISSFKEDKQVSLEKYIWVVFNGKLCDSLRFKYRRKNHIDIAGLTDNNSEDGNKYELQDNSIIDLNKPSVLEIASEVLGGRDYQIFCMQVDGFNGEDIASALKVSTATISLRWNIIKNIIAEELKD